jgi:hypothetical protein
MTLHRYAVGEPYGGKPKTWPETPHLRLSPAGCELVLFYGAPTRDEVRDVKSGVVQWAWVESERVAVMCFRIGTMPWSDAPFEVHRVPEDERGIPAGGPDDGLLVTVMLVDATDATIRVIRVVTWPAAFAEKVRDTVRRHLDAPPVPTAAAAALEALYAEYPSERLAKERADARC